MGIDAIRAFFLPRSSREDQPPRPDPVTVAACALLLEIAHADDVFVPEGIAELLGFQHPEVQEVKERVAGRHS